jgi:hypothetical protein
MAQTTFGTTGFTIRVAGLARELKTPIHLHLPLQPGTAVLPSPVKLGARPYEAIWDTGATNTVVSPRVVKDLGAQAHQGSDRQHRQRSKAMRGLPG